MKLSKTIKHLFCSHKYKTITGYEDKTNNCWVVVQTCIYCNKKFTKRYYYPPKCKISGNNCYKKHKDPVFDNCRLCHVYEYKSLYKNE